MLWCVFRELADDTQPEGQRQNSTRFWLCHQVSERTRFLGQWVASHQFASGVLVMTAAPLHRDGEQHCNGRVRARKRAVRYIDWQSLCVSIQVDGLRMSLPWQVPQLTPGLPSR